MAGRSRRAWFSVLLGLVVGFTLASRLILPRATELKRSGHKRKASVAGGGAAAACGGAGGGGVAGLRRDHGGLLMWPPPERATPPTERSATRAGHFLFVGVMTAQKYLNNRAVAAYR